MLLAVPTWSERLDHPAREQIITISQLLEEDSRDEKYYLKGVRENPYLNEELVCTFPTRIIARPETDDHDFSDQLLEIVDRLGAQGTESSGGEEFHEELIQEFTLNFEDFLAVVECGRP